MATHAAIAARDRESKEKIADKDRKQAKYFEEKKLALAKERAIYQNIKDSAGATKDLVTGAASLMKGGKGGKSGNHPEWYKKFVAGYSAGNLPTYTRLGVLNADYNFAVANSVSDAYNTYTDAVHLPGICVFHYVSTLANPGTDSDPRSRIPINVGLSKLMANLRALNSRVGNYDPADLGLYFYAAADYMYIIEKLRQALQLCQTYLAENAYFCKGMLHALGWNPDFVIENQADLKQLLRRHIRIFNSSITVPKELTFFARRMWMAKAFIKDHKGNKSQIYAFAQDAIGVLSADESKVDYGASNMSELAFTTMSQIENKFNTIKTNLVDSVGMVTIIADIRAGLNEFFILDEYKGDEIIEFTDGDYDLEQIHNLRTMPCDPRLTSGTPVIASHLSIQQDTDGYLWQGLLNGSTYERPRFTVNMSLTSQRPSGVKSGIGSAGWTKVYNAELLNVYKEDVTEDDVYEATRLRHVVHQNSTDNTYGAVTCGTEVVLFGMITVLGGGGNWIDIPYSTYMLGFITAIQAASGATLLQLGREMTYINNVLSIYSRFDWLPVFRFMDNATASGNISGQVFGEFDNYFPLSNQNLAMLHEASCLSMFYIDGKTIRFTY